MKNDKKKTAAKAVSADLHNHHKIVRKLEKLLKKDKALSIALEASLVAAVDAAKTNLNEDLYKAINYEFKGNGWPVTIESYLHYLDLYVRLIPNEEDNPCYPNAWKSNDQANGYNQKVYDLLCQFYWLVDQPAGITGQTLQSFKDFSDWLEEFAKAWGEFLDTEESLTKETLNSFKYDTMYNFELYSDHEQKWTTFNEFFYREFNDVDPETGITPLRPIAEPNNNETIVAGADCTFKMNYDIDKKGHVLDETGNKSKITLKHTHSIGTVDELLDGSKYSKDFYGGTFVHYFLSPFDYHRFHASVGGKVLEIKAVQGKVFLNVDLTSDGQWDAPDGSEDGYEFNQARGIVIVDAGKTVGKVAIIPIGMAQVSGVDMYTDLKGKKLAKGQEFGKFKFGGSDIILLFEKAPDLYLFKNDPGHNPIHFQYGQTVAYWNQKKEK